MRVRADEAHDQRADPRFADRMRWRCRRGMLELDLVLNAFRERHLAALDATRVEAFTAILGRTDPELLDLIMGRSEALDEYERELLHLMRMPLGDSSNALTPDPPTLTPDPSPEGRGEANASLLPPGEGSG